MLHALKTWPEYFEAVRTERKRFEMRVDDRDYAAGDELLLMEWDPAAEGLTGRALTVCVGFVLRDAERFGLRDGFVAMSITPAPGSDEAWAMMLALHLTDARRR